MHGLQGDGTGASYPRRHVYCFDPSALQSGHHNAQSAFSQALQRGDAVVVSDNTNVLPKHFKPYLAAAASTSAERSGKPTIRILRFDCPQSSEPLLRLLAGRNSHAVSLEACRRMRDRLAGSPYAGKTGKEFVLPVAGAPEAVIAARAGADAVVDELLAARRARIASMAVPPCPVVPAHGDRTLLGAYLCPASRAALAAWTRAVLPRLPRLALPVVAEAGAGSDGGAQLGGKNRRGSHDARAAAADVSDGWEVAGAKRGGARGGGGDRGGTEGQEEAAAAGVAFAVHEDDMEEIADHMTIVYRPSAIELSAAPVGATVLLRPVCVARCSQGLVAVQVEALSLAAVEAATAAHPELVTQSTMPVAGADSSNDVFSEVVLPTGFGGTAAPSAPSLNKCPHVTVMKHKSVSAAESNDLLQSVPVSKAPFGNFRVRGTGSPAVWAACSHLEKSAGSAPVLVAVVGVTTGPPSHPSTKRLFDREALLQFLISSNIPTA
jgi:hypothetical protein